MLGTVTVLACSQAWLGLLLASTVTVGSAAESTVGPAALKERLDLLLASTAGPNDCKHDEACCLQARAQPETAACQDGPAAGKRCQHCRTCSLQALSALLCAVVKRDVV